MIPLSALTALAGGVGGVWLARLLGGSLYGARGPRRRAAVSLSAAGTWTDALAAAAVVAVLAVGAMLYPVLRPAGGATGSAAAARPRSPARPGPAPTWA